MVPRHKTWLNAEELMASGSIEIEALGGIGPPCAVAQGLTAGVRGTDATWQPGTRSAFTGGAHSLPGITAV